MKVGQWNFAIDRSIKTLFLLKWIYCSLIDFKNIDFSNAYIKNYRVSNSFLYWTFQRVSHRYLLPRPILDDVDLLRSFNSFDADFDFYLFFIFNSFALLFQFEFSSQPFRGWCLTMRWGLGRTLWWTIGMRVYNHKQPSFFRKLQPQPKSKMPS